MPVLYNGNSLIPAPLVTVVENHTRKGTTVFVEDTFTLTGTILNLGISLDSPAALGHNGTTDGIIAEQARIRGIFNRNSDGGLLQIVSPASSGSNISAYCTIESVDFASSVWVPICNYTVVLKCNQGIQGDASGTIGLADFNETWTVNENEDRTFSMSHNIEARGTLSYGGGGLNNPLQVAQNYVSSRRYSTGLTGTLNHPANESFAPSGFFAGLNDSSSYWNYSAVENIDPVTFSYGVTENFIYYPSGNARETWNASYSVSLDNPMKANVSLAGSIIGYSDRNSNYSVRSQNAQTYFFNSIAPNIYSRLLGYCPSGYTLKTTPTVQRVDFQYTDGSLRYDYNFDAFRGNLISGAIEESISVSDIGNTDIFAQIPIPGKMSGPLVQYMRTSTLPQRSISISAIIAPDSSGAVTTATLLSSYLGKPDTNSIISILKPTGVNFYVSEDREEWNPIRRSYQRQVNFLIDNQGTSVAGIPIASGNPFLG